MSSKMLFCLPVVLCLCVIIGEINSSAIPIWEFLRKDEKMSYLYQMFKNQVDGFCEENTIENCNAQLLEYGTSKLKNMPEDHLDNMDPSQRGAHSIIWESMMEGHKMMKTTPKPRSSTTAKPNSYEDDSFGDSFGEASAKIDNVYRVPPPSGFVFKIESGTPEYTYPHNFQYIPTSQKFNKQSAYNKFQQFYPAPTTTTTTTQRPLFYFRNYEDVPLTGPMVVRVYPDGRPVREPQQSPPHDEDLKQYQLTKMKIPYF